LLKGEGGVFGYVQDDRHPGEEVRNAGSKTSFGVFASKL
jgi:hypothetical protein